MVINKKFSLIVIFMCLPLLIGAKKNAPFQVNGVRGKLLTNIESRLNELEANKPIAAETDDELRDHIEKAMYPYGYFKPTISITRQGDNNLIITIHQGPRLVIGKLLITLVGTNKLTRR
jgi:translocation and assembly module TamA